MKWSPKHLDILANSNASFNIAYGSVSSGKSYVFNIRWYKHIYDVPDRSLLVMSGKTLTSLYDNTIRCQGGLEDLNVNGDLDFKRISGGVVNRIIVQSTGTEIACVSADNESSWMAAQGKSTAGWLADEIVHQPENMTKSLQKSCRHQGKVWPKFFTCNTSYPSHYFKQQYIDNTDIDKNVWICFLEDNWALSKEYKKELIDTYKGMYKDRFILARWVSAEGVIYDQFRRDKHIVPHSIIEGHLNKGFIDQLFLGIDWGYDHPMGIVLMGKDRDGGWWVIDEYKETGIVINEHFINNILLPFATVRRRVLATEAICDSSRPDLIHYCNNATNKIYFSGSAKYKGSVNAGIEKVNKKFS
ncbi:hypothetical protein LCGC14_2018730, partial [marine sediment metagenome]